MRKKNILLLMFCLIGMNIIHAQQLSIQGVIIDKKTGEPLIGASVLEKGTTNGTITNYDGNFSITVSKGATLVFSYIGYNEKEITVQNQNFLRIELEESTKLLDEIVVVGYGTQKAKDLTAPISTVKGTDLSKQITSNPMSALQGKMTGVQIINSGSPGSGPSVKIRGVGSIGDYANPLYIVDGVFVDNVDFLSSSDIEDLTVLKDASAAAIYGVRAANGVVLVTTKKGKIDQTNISYDGYVGLQIPTNVLKLANTEQYVELMNEANFNTPGYTPKVASSYPASTDWYNELLRNAITHNHSLDISGATEKTSYSLGVNYFYQQGIMDAKNDYERYNIRARVDQKVNNWLNFGINTVFSNYSTFLSDNEAFFKAYVSPPVYPVYDDTNIDAYPVKFGSPQDYGFGAVYANPVAIAYYNNNKENGLKSILSTYAEVSLIKNKLTFRTSYNLDYNSWRSRDYTPEHYVGGSQGLNQSSLSKTFSISYRHILDNLLTYNDKVGNHSFSVLLGESTRNERKYSMIGTALNVPYVDEQSLYLSRGSASSLFVRDYIGDTNPYAYNGISFFTRASYNYADKYLATLTFRADGSSKYQQKWGYFPSIGVGWILTSENFMQNQHLFNFLKFRASWGRLGNDNVPANSAVILGQTGMASSAVFGNDILYEGVGSQTVLQNTLKWEVVDELNVGFDFSMVHQNLRGEIDYYNRTTNNAVFYAPIASGGGVATLLGNWGTIRNQGIELNLNWNEKVSKDFSYNVGFNITTIDNKVVSLNGKRDFIPDGLIRGNYTTRTAVGHPIGAFYGYEIDGVFASEGDALRDPVSQDIKQAGYFKYKDQNGDKVIDEKDKVYLGSAIPLFTSGLDLGMNYKKFDVSVTLQGQYGNKILNAKRMNRDIFTDGNYDLDFYENHWSENNKSNTYPSAEAYNKAFIQQANDFFVEDGSYFRVQNVQIGYNFDTIRGLKNLRLYLSAQRPFTYFTYKGFTPEVSGGPTTSGIDTQTYPMQAIYTFGLKLNL
ncbi:MAG: TonB-dependent Receptor Plug Domain protein [Bacteroidetes bacterium ADurb.BinA395]|nr:MAG: TonB-dependent Receptor Plug Domain protein [Bacteroidetes bacterium ADurb.BinA395]